MSEKIIDGFLPTEEELTEDGAKDEELQRGDSGEIPADRGLDEDE